MRLTAKEAALLNDAERDLLKAKGPWRVADLVKLIRRLRTMRDRAADLLQRQALSGRSGRGRAEATPERSAAKLALLQKALGYYRAELDVIDNESRLAVGELCALEALDAKAVPAAQPQAATEAAKTVKATNSGKAATRAAAKPAASTGASSDAAPAGAKAAAAKAARPAASAPAKSAKARQAPVRKSSGLAGSQGASAASQRTRARKSRPG